MPKLQSGELDTFEKSLDSSFFGKAVRLEPAPRHGGSIGVPPRIFSDDFFLNSIFVVVTILFCTLLGLYTSSRVPIANVAMIYLLGVVLVASKCGGRAGLMTCVLSILAFDLFIAEPRYQIGPLDQQLPFTYGVMFLVAYSMNYLTGTIRELLGSLEKRVKERTRELEIEVKRRESTEVELTTAVETLIKSNMTLTNFGRLASHDLQEPLRTIEGFSSLMQDRYNDVLDESGQKFLAIINNTARSAGDNIESLLIQARSRAEDKEFTRVDLNRLLDGVLSSLSQALSVSGARVEKDRLPLIWGSEPLLCHLFQNLLENAIKYRGESAPMIQIRYEKVDDRSLITIVDNGIGFNSRYRKKIFEPFVRVTGREGPSGSGLGLAICKSIVELHGGRIAAHGKPGRGTVVLISLPGKIESGGEEENG